jgi:hypothetical protein
MKLLYIGDKELGKAFYQTKISLNKSFSIPLINRDIIIDLDSTRIDSKKLKEILLYAKEDFYFRISSIEKINRLLPYFTKVIYLTDKEPFNIFDCLRKIFLATSREEVFKYLRKYKPPIRLLMKWIISNIDYWDEENLKIVQIIDTYIEKVREEIIFRLMAGIKPTHSPGRIYYYNFKKGEVNEPKD